MTSEPQVPSCPLCGAEVTGYQFLAALVYHVPYAGPFGGPGTFIVRPGEEPPPQARGADRITRAPKGMDCFILEPCGCRLREIVFFQETPDGPVVRIEGKEYIPL